jgi:hypothetical protein
MLDLKTHIKNKIQMKGTFTSSEIVTSTTTNSFSKTESSGSSLSNIISRVLTTENAERTEILEMENLLNSALDAYKGERRREMILSDMR